MKRGGHFVQYTTDFRENEISVLLNQYQLKVKSKNLVIPHTRLLIACLEYREPMSLYAIQILGLGVMDLLVRYVYPVLSGYAKANIIFYMKRGEEGEEIAKPLNKQSIPLTLDDGTPIPKSEIYAHIFRSIFQLIENYEGFSVSKIAIRAYFQDDIKGRPYFIEELLEVVLSECLNFWRKKYSQFTC